jgi:hypothetical protein
MAAKRFFLIIACCTSGGLTGLADHGADFVSDAGGVLAEGHGPGAVAVAVFDLAVEANVAGGRDLFF